MEMARGLRRSVYVGIFKCLRRSFSFQPSKADKGLQIDHRNKPEFSPYTYTSGRWLRLDEEHLQVRSAIYDFNKLCRKAISCIPGAREIVQCIKIEGGSNRSFLLQCDNGRFVVARITFSSAGPSRLVTSSEVATMSYIRRYTSIPVPTVLAWSDDPHNSIGTEYTIMEHAAGDQLHQKWPSMTTSEQLQVVQSLGQYVQEMSKLRFSAFGSIYFDNAPVDQSHLLSIGDGFSIGPHCGNRYWPGQPGDERSYQRQPPNRGPWTTHEQYCYGLVDAGLSQIPSATPDNILECKGTVEEHLLLNSAAKQIFSQLVQLQSLKDVERPMLLHRDLHKRNIFVSKTNPGQITSIIDWQSSSIEPVHHYSDEIPDLCDFPDSWDHAVQPEELTEEQQKIAKGVSICRRAWAAITKGWLPELHAARTLDQDLIRLFRYIPSAWRHGATPVREDLIQLSMHWPDPLRLPGSCPYQPSGLDRHKRLWEEFKMAREIKDEIVKGLNTDEEGWVPVDRWEDTYQAYRLLFGEWIKGMVEAGEMTEEKARKFWPFDIPE